MALMNRFYEAFLTHDITANQEKARLLAEGADVSALPERDREIFVQSLAILECFDRETASYHEYVEFASSQSSRAELAAFYLKKVFRTEDSSHITALAADWYEKQKACHNP